MNHIIPIDENARILVEPLNFTLQYRRISKTKISWRTDGYFSDMASLITEYINMSPQRADNAIMSLEELTATLREAEAKLSHIIR
jgi:hypothetical protein